MKLYVPLPPAIVEVNEPTIPEHVTPLFVIVNGGKVVVVVVVVVGGKVVVVVVVDDDVTC